MRVKRSFVRARRRKKIMKKARGFRGAKNRSVRMAKEAVRHSERYAYENRRKKKRDFRTLWIARINAAVRLHGMSYSKFILGLKKAQVRLNRKVLSNMAILEKENFAKIVELAKQNLSS